MSVTSSPDNDSADFIEHARWLLEWHNARSEALTTRAVALLGFVGVILALLLQGSGLKGIEASPLTSILFVASVFVLLLCAFFALRTISPEPTAMPKVSQLRESWATYTAKPYPGTTAQQIAESLLNGQKLTEDSALSSALEHADSRAKWFSYSTKSMLVALLLLSLLLSDILFNSWWG